ncbi:MAG: dTMP kinase [Deltaproteobacteria bacterium]|nr:dTMP kinase [Deltaproteobacteria bacterium]
MIVQPEDIIFEKPRGFLVLDGANGAGKTTLMHKLVEHLRRQSLPVLATREPGSTKLGQTLRKILLESEPDTVAPLTEVFLFAADRHNHVQKIIQPALARREMVISDRYYYSTAAFQGYDRMLDLHAVSTINSLAINGCLPDLLILLDLDPEEGLRRTKLRAESEGKDGFESESIDFHHRLRQGFIELARTCAEPVWVVDAEQTPDSIWRQILPIIERWSAAFQEVQRNCGEAP